MKDTDSEHKNATFRVAPYRLNRGKKTLHIYCHTQAEERAEKGQSKKRSLRARKTISAAINFFLANAFFIRR
jgi:hypothetical protein